MNVDTAGLSSELAAAVERALASGQESPFRFWDRLDSAGRERLAGALAEIDFDQLRKLVAEHVAGGRKAAEVDAATVKPAPVARLPRSEAEKKAEQRFAKLGEEALAAGRVAVLTVAGGQGTRLGFDGPKGCFPVGPITDRTLFRHHAEKVLALSRRAGRAVPWLVMSSPAGFWVTSDYLSGERFFGLDADKVFLFRQGTMPAVDPGGQLMLTAPDRLAVSPNGHGGTVAALHDAGLLDKLTELGVDTLFYFQVDNPLVKVADPVFLGRHLEAGAEMSLKVVAKRNAAEKVGVVVKREEHLEVIEYSDLPAELGEAVDANGELVHWAGSIAIHIFSIPFLKTLAASGGGLPFHRADKKVACVDENGQTVQPEEQNAIKFESFIFDALPRAERALAVETSRVEEFAPVKNATGTDSAESCRQMLAAEWTRWIELAGGSVPRTPEGAVNGKIEISPLYALDAAELAEKLAPGFEMKPGADLVLE